MKFVGTFALREAALEKSGSSESATFVFHLRYDGSLSGEQFGRQNPYGRIEVRADTDQARRALMKELGAEFTVTFAPKKKRAQK